MISVLLHYKFILPIFISLSLSLSLYLSLSILLFIIYSTFSLPSPGIVRSIQREFSYGGCFVFTKLLYSIHCFVQVLITQPNKLNPISHPPNSINILLRSNYIRWFLFLSVCRLACCSGGSIFSVFLVEL